MAEPKRGAPSTTDNSNRTSPQKLSTKRRWPARVAKAVGVLVLVGLVGSVLAVVIGYTSTSIPDANADFQTNTSFVYYRDGKTQLGNFAIQNRQTIDYDQMSPTIKEAIVAAENRSFWTDPGFSVRGMARAAFAIVRGGDVQGGSTITQQYIKIYYLNSEQTITRKIKEVFLAAKIGRTVPKEQILADYLNTIYYGRGAYGIQAASQSYFKTDASKLTVPQAAVLASVVNNPSLFDPSVDDSNEDRLLGRYDYVLQGMAEAGQITPEEEAEYAASLPKFPDVPINQRYAGAKGFLMKMTERELVAAGIPESQISGGGLKIVTTFDKDSEDAAIETAKSVTSEAAEAAGEKASGLHAAIASVDVGTGEVRAIYGGPDYIKNSRNWATTPRPTASTFKTFSMAAGLDDGYSLRSGLNGNTFTPTGDSTPVRNEFSYQYGRVSLLRAITLSINTAFVDLTTSMTNGAEKVTDAAAAAGAPELDNWPDDPRNLTLGSAEVSPLNMANAYATYGNDGVRVTAHVIKQVDDLDGQTVYQAAQEEKRAVSSDIAKDVTFALTDVVEQGTGRSVQTLNRPVAAKTGTKDGDKDDIVSAWFVGYTKQISTAVMFVSGDAGTGDLDTYKRPGDSTFFGGTYPAQTWADYMQVASEGMPVEQFDQPAYVNPNRAAPVQPARPRYTQAPRTNAPSPTDTPSEAPSSSAPSSSAPSSSSAPTTSSPPTQSSQPSQSSGPSRPATSAPPSSAPTRTSGVGGGGPTPAR